MNTKIGTSLGLTLVMVFGVVATMLALGLFGPGKANAAAPTPQSMTASPGSPGDTSSIKIGLETDEEISGNSGELWVAFDAKYGIPATIAKTAVSIASGQTTGGVSNPLIDPTVDEQIAASSPLSVGDTIIKLQIGDTAPNTTSTVEGLSVNTDQNDHTVTFSTSAGITLPTAASTKEIWLSKDQGTTWSTATATADTNAITVVRELTLSSSSGARGKSVTATGKGFTTTGNATLWIDTDDGGDIDTTEYIIASDIDVSGGEFEYEFTTDTNFPLSTVALNAQGGDGNSVSTSTNPTFNSYGSISLDKSEVARGASLKVSAVDHQAGTISSITIGGVTQTLPTDKVIDTTGVEEAFTITVAATTPLGSQKISMTSSAEGSPTARYTTVTITGAPVTVSPTTAVAGQEVTVTGTGFTKSDDLDTVTVGGETVTYVSSGGLDTTDTIAANVETDSSGNFSTSFLIPDSTTTRTAGDHKILVTDDGGLTGEVFITVPGRTLTLSVDESKRGSEVTVTGTGYEADGSVALTYLSGTTSTSLGSATADSYGEFTKVVTIPNTPAIPSTNTITGAISGGGSKTTAHKIPESSIALDVSESETGSSVTITGVGFPAYATVGTMTIGGLDVRPTPAPSTDVDGGFTSTVMVPGLTAGNHTVKVTASSVTGSISLKVVATTAAVVAASTATEDVFADSIAADNLVRVWKFNNADQSWSFYDPREAFAAANTLANTASGDIVWVNVTAEEAFQSTTLYPGWNLISLD
ncbi:MAG: IPT/TIG domain-containing protein [Chloroflexota bacterium]|nr:IPT/TIG domain-containing protein [Chloroflexota bacterium]